MSDFRIIEATINPKRLDTLRDRVLPYVGKRMRFTHAWHIEGEDSTAYAGQDAWVPYVDPQDPDSVCRYAAIGWLPTEDLDDINPTGSNTNQDWLTAVNESIKVATDLPTFEKVDIAAHSDQENLLARALGKLPPRTDDKFVRAMEAMRKGVGPMKVQMLSDSLISYGVDVLDGVRHPCQNHHVVSYKYADDGSVVSRTETTTRTYADDDEDES